MSATVGYATLQVIPSARGFGPALGRATTPAMAGAGSVGGKAMGANMLSMAKRFAGPLAAVFGAAAVVGVVKDAAALDAQMREVVTLFGVTGKAADRELGKIQEGVRGVSNEFGIAQTTLTDGLYQAISAGVPKSNVFEFMRVASAASKAGVTDVDTAVDGLTTTINAFGLEASDAQAVADSMFAAVKGGKTTFGELSSSLFNVAPSASAAGVGFEEVNASIAALTAQGVPTSVATTKIRSALTALVKPSEDLDKVFKKVGFSSASAALKQKGLKFALDTVYDAADGSTGKLFGLLRRTEAVDAANVLAGKGSKKFADEIERQGTAAGSTGDALAVIEEGLGAKWAQLTNRLKNFGLQIGQYLLPPLADFVTLVIDKISPALDTAGQAVQGFFNGKGIDAKGGFLGQATESFAELLEAVKPIAEDIVRVFADDLVPAVKDFWHAIEPAVLWLAEQGLPALIGQLQGLWTVIGGVVKIFAGVLNFLTGVFTGDWSKAWKGIKQIAAGVWDVLRGLIKTVLSNIVFRIIPGLLAKIPKLFLWAWRQTLKVIVSVSAAIGQKVKGWLDRIANNVRVLGGWLLSKFGSILSWIREKFSEIFSRIVDTVRTKGSQILDWFRDLPGRIKNVFSSAGTWLKDAGVSIVEGLLDGAGSILPSVGQFFVDKLPGWIQTPFKKALGINSPSKVFAGYGDNIAEGLTMGVERSKGKAQSAVSGMVGVPRTPNVSHGGAMAAAVAASGGEQPIVLTLDGKVVSETVFAYGGRKLNHGRV